MKCSQGSVKTHYSRALASSKSLFSLRWFGGTGASIALASVLTFMIIPNLIHSNTISLLDDLEMLAANANLDLVTK